MSILSDFTTPPVYLAIQQTMIVPRVEGLINEVLADCECSDVKDLSTVVDPQNARIPREMLRLSVVKSTTTHDRRLKFAAINSDGKSNRCVPQAV